MMTPNAPVRQHKMRFEAVPPTARTARRFVAEVLRTHGATTDEISDVTLVASELVSNIIEHGACPTLVIVLDVADPEVWQLSVVGGPYSGDSVVLKPENWSVAHPDDQSGRGLGIVRQLMDEISVDRSAGNLGVICRRRRATSLGTI